MSPPIGPLPAADRPNLPDDLAREAYCLLGIQLDAIQLDEVLDRIYLAAESKVPYFISTPNVHFLVKGQADPEFKESLLASDLCLADGMPIIWIARLLKVAIEGRVAGSDLFERLKRQHRCGKPLRLFFFGGDEGVATEAGKALNAEGGNLICTGSIYPGFGSVGDMSRDEIIEAVNRSEADLLVVAIGAEKGQAWLTRNHGRLRIPIRANLGATINFQAGRVKRAPPLFRRSGLEWLWRLKEEPHLWRRYSGDGIKLISLLLFHVLPLVLAKQWTSPSQDREGLLITPKTVGTSTILTLSGSATKPHAIYAAAQFREASAVADELTIDLSRTTCVDARFLGLFLMLRKHRQQQGGGVRFVGASASLKRAFHFHGASFLFSQ